MKGIAIDCCNRRVIYGCSTIYHVYITVLKAIINLPSVDVDIYLDDFTIPNVDGLASRIRKSGLFRNVIVLKRKNLLLSIHPYELRRIICRVFVSTFDKQLGFLRSYDDIYIYNDSDWVAMYATDRHIYYHTIEDGLDCFKLFDECLENTQRRPIFKRFMRDFLNFPWAMTESKYCLDVEINDAHELATKIDKPLVVVPRTRLLSNARDHGIEVLFDIFPIPDVSEMNGGVLILTLPNEAFRGPHSFDFDQIDFCRRLQKRFYGRRCFIKPHPRDYTDYAAILSQVVVIPRELPIEILNLSNKLKMYAAVSYCSTSTGGIKFSEHLYICKRGMNIHGVDYLDLNDSLETF